MSSNSKHRLGALPDKNGVQFRVWAPNIDEVELVLGPEQTELAMEATESGYFEQYVPSAETGMLYRFRTNGENLFPDPASRFQPEGVHGPSMVINPGGFTWTDAHWTGVPQKDLVFYELHVGTFSEAGTFDGVQEHLDYLKELGITAIELMPVADFPGRWNWGYDQAALYAPSRAYGHPNDLRALVDAAHNAGLAVFLDVIYNHLGPDGAYAAAFAPFFTDKHETPWGQAINLDDEHSGGVRNFFIDNALHWLREYHIDGLRLDAVFAIKDSSETHFLAELADAVKNLSQDPPRVLVAEDHRDLNTIIKSRNNGGYGLDAMWIDDFHHQVRNMTAGDTQGYFGDYADSTMDELSDTVERGWFFDGRIAPTTGKPRGTDPTGIALEQCVFCIQNHDQIGNRPTGNRLTDDISLPAYRAASALLLFLPELPLLFMGQEWAASTPFQYFTDHNEELGQLVREGRTEEFEHFGDFEGTIPDPQDPDTFHRSKLKWAEIDQPSHHQTYDLYRDLLELRPRLDGAVQTHVHSPTAMTLVRGEHHLLVTFAGDALLPRPENSERIWHTEQPSYASTPHPPEHREENVYFAVPGAVLLRSD